MEGTHPLKTWRERQSLSQDDAADRFGVTKATVSRWENRVRQPSLTQAAKLSEVTGIPLDDFVPQDAEVEQ